MSIPSNVAANTVATYTSSSSAGGAVLQNSFQATTTPKPTNTEGSSTFPPGGACKESRAVAAGRAVTLVGADFACQGVQGITLVIGDTYHSVHSGFSFVNMELGCNGEQGCCANIFSLNGPMVT